MNTGGQQTDNPGKTSVFHPIFPISKFKQETRAFFFYSEQNLSLFPSRTKSFFIDFYAKLALLTSSINDFLGLSRKKETLLTPCNLRTLPSGCKWTGIKGFYSMLDVPSGSYIAQILGY